MSEIVISYNPLSGSGVHADHPQTDSTARQAACEATVQKMKG